MRERQTYRNLALIAAMALFMQSLDATILNTALPAISADLHESPLEMQMTIISYSLTVALFIPLTGWIADKYGTLNVFRVAVTIFVLGSVACAASHSLNALIWSRVLQGLGGALMMPVARLAIIRNVPKTQLVAAWNAMAMAGLIGPVLGPIVGGWLVTHATWHWIFLMNIPIGVLGIWFAGRHMPNSTGNISKLDWWGFVLFAGGLAGVTLGLDLLSEERIAQWLTILILAVGLGCFSLYYLYAKRAQNPLLPLNIFVTRTFRIGIVGNMFIRLSGSGIPFLMPLMLQVVFGYNADVAGWLLAPIALSSVLTKSFAGKILARFGYKTTLILTALSMTFAIATMSLLQQHTPIWLLVLILAWYGCAMSIIFTAVNTLAISDLSDHNASAGSTYISVTQQVGISIGIAVSAVILDTYRHLIGETGEQLQHAFSATFLTSALFGIALLWVLSHLKKEDGAGNFHKG
ncbi:DHA2 family efflux MFS transporter permease subunit [Aggregatibacter kilianii]|uniref:DHA2 family efflux MFS transporter permease subunit n=1 Tax=Aggregatibacter kilianii TaxID=2025884 RepID=UPI000D65719A|nr:DHA2 family efflux MFS transporter permease subunit [Aggregatibacter kilianii]